MAFEQEPTVTPDAIGKMTIILIDYDGIPANSDANFQIEVLNTAGQLMRSYRGNLLPHITAAQKQGLIDFMADLRTQANSEILPP